MKAKKISIILGVLIAIVAFICSISAFAEKDSIHSCQDVVECIKFNPNENIKYTNTVTINGEEFLSYDSDIACYKVNAASKEVCCVYRKDISAPKFTITTGEAQEKAISFIKKYRPDFNLDEMVLTSVWQHDSKNDYSYEFEWRTFVDEIDIGHSIVIQVSGSGDFLLYVCTTNNDYKIDLSKIKVDQRSAIDIALNSISSQNRRDKNIPLIAYNPQKMLYNDKIVWQVYLGSERPSEEYEEECYIILIDAETGNILELFAG